MPQLNYSQNAIPAQPGMVYDLSSLSAGDIVSRVAAVTIPFGVRCEVIQSGSQAGMAQPVQGKNLAGTVTVTNASAAITFSTAQTIAAGQAVTFSAQPGVIYYIVAAISAGTTGALDRAYNGTTSSTGTTALMPYTTAGDLGVSVFDPLGTEQQYTTFGVPTALAGTVSVTNGSASITFSQNQTLAAGAQLTFSSQPGVVYQLAAAITAGTAGTLVTNYSGATNASATTTLQPTSSTSNGWKAGQAVPFLRRGRIWAAFDTGGTQARNGAVNVWHSSDGTHAQGVFTFSAVAQTAGAEIDVAPGTVVWNPDLVGLSYVDPFGNGQTVGCVEINI